MVTRMQIVLEPGMDTGMVALFELKRFLCGGNAATDLDPGKYQLAPDFHQRVWKILHVGARSNKEQIRFTLDIDGPDPRRSLPYAHLPTRSVTIPTIAELDTLATWMESENGKDNA